MSDSGTETRWEIEIICKMSCFIVNISLMPMRQDIYSRMEYEKSVLLRREFNAVPGVELANFAVNNSYKERHKEYKGIGEIIFLDFVRPIAKGVSMQIGVRMLYIFVLPYSRLVNYYHRQLRFDRLPLLEEYFTHKRIKPRYDRNCIFMYQLIG